MLQLIGWLMCLYLVIKGCEFIADKSYRVEKDNWMNGTAVIAMALCFLGAFVFAVALYVQGSQISTPTP